MTLHASCDIHTIEWAHNRAVVLDDDTLFYATGYKMLRSQSRERLAACACARFNGHVQLVYFTRNCVPLLQFAHGATYASTARVLKDLVDAVLDMRGNGFLSDRGLLLDAQSVYIDPTTESVKLLYVPLTCPVAGANDVEVGRRVFDTCQVALAIVSKDTVLSGSAAYEWGKLEMLREDLERLADPPGARMGRHTRGIANAGEASGAVTYVLMTRTGGRSTSVRVAGEGVVVGKSASRAGCVVNVSPAISRAHCMLSVKRDGSLGVTDLGSSNGTWVDGVRIEPHTEHVVHDGGTLKLADVVFSVRKAEG